MQWQNLVLINFKFDYSTAPDERSLNVYSRQKPTFNLRDAADELVCRAPEHVLLVLGGGHGGRDQ